mgnify:CR=1 FL=1
MMAVAKTNAKATTTSRKHQNSAEGVEHLFHALVA